MKLFLLWTIVLSVLVSVGPTANAEDKPDPEKPVRLVWFPRFSPDSKFLITAHGSWEEGVGGEVRIWNADRGGEPKLVITTERGIRTVEWSTKGKFFAAGGYGKVAYLYDAASGVPIDQFLFPGSVEVLQITPDEKRLVTVHGGGSVRINEIKPKKQIHSWEQVHRGGIWGARLSPEGNLLATAGRDGFVRIFDLEKLEIMHQLKHPGETNGVAFTNDGKHLLTGCTDAAIRVFRVADGAELRKLTGHDGGSVTDMQFSPDGKLLASSGIDRTVRLWNMEDFEEPKLEHTFRAHDGLAFGVAISPNGKWLASAGWDDAIKVWDLKTREELWSWSR